WRSYVAIESARLEDGALAQARHPRARHPAAARELHAGRTRRRSGVRGRAPGERLQAGRGPRSASGPGVSSLRLGHPEPNPQTSYLVENLKKPSEAAGPSLSHVVKAQVFLTDLVHFSGFDEVWREYFPTPPPRTTIGSSGLLVPGCLVEVDLTAAMPRAAARV